jgi:transcription elongation factor Elf1
MGIFASISILECPMCGTSLTVTGMVFSDESELHVKECENCRIKLQIRKDAASGSLIIEKLRPS